jgi:hypothetical protein
VATAISLSSGVFRGRPRTLKSRLRLDDTIPSASSARSACLGARREHRIFATPLARILVASRSIKSALKNALAAFQTSTVQNCVTVSAVTTRGARSQRRSVERRARRMLPGATGIAPFGAPPSQPSPRKRLPYGHAAPLGEGLQREGKIGVFDFGRSGLGLPFFFFLRVLVFFRVLVFGFQLCFPVVRCPDTLICARS